MVGAVAFVSRIDNGNTLLIDASNSPAVAVDANDHFVWRYVTDTDPGGALAQWRHLDQRPVQHQLVNKYSPASSPRP
jgi:hypothetical protein